MKVNKITAIVCLLITIISCVLLLFYKDNVMLQSILSGIFTGFIVSLVVAIIGYLHERAKTIAAIEDNIKSLFFNITVMSIMLGKILPQIHNSVTLQDFQFKSVYGLSGFNPQYIEKMNLSLYSPIFPKSKKDVICKKLKDFLPTTYNIKNRSFELFMQVLKYNCMFLEIQKNQTMGLQVNLTPEKNLDDLKNLINIRTAKLHEYTTAQSLEIGKIAKDFFGDKVWKDIEAILINEAEAMVKGNL